jgi:hypothetical protein
MDPGMRHRAATRAVFGAPGSIRRWLIGTAVWLFACFLVFLFVDFLLRIVVLVFALVVPFAAFKAREMMVGDEDELAAHVRKDARVRPAASAELDEVPLPPEAWLSHSNKNFDDVPPPPVAEEDLGGSDYVDTAQAEPPVPFR